MKNKDTLTRKINRNKKTNKKIKIFGYNRGNKKINNRLFLN